MSASMAGRFRQQAAACAGLGSPMYAELLGLVAIDIDVGGYSADVLSGHENDPGPSALALRLAGSMHRLVLAGSAPELAGYYPSMGGSWDPSAGGATFLHMLRDQPEQVRSWLDQAPQTNEVGRASALMGGLLRVGKSHRLPVRLLEIGSSGGLNLRADEYFYEGFDGWRFGRQDSPVRLEGAWAGAPLDAWRDLAVVERVGCDVHPVDVSTLEGRLTLTSYVWPDQLSRLERLRNAFRVAETVPAEVLRQDAASFVREIELVEGTTTVLWHSVMWQYMSHRERDEISARIVALGGSATASAPFAHLSLEPARRTPESEHEFLVVLKLWPGGERRILGTSVAHGMPTTWE